MNVDEKAIQNFPELLSELNNFMTIVNLCVELKKSGIYPDIDYWKFIENNSKELEAQLQSFVVYLQQKHNVKQIKRPE